MKKRKISLSVLICVCLLVFTIIPFTVRAQENPKLPTSPGASSVVTTPGSLVYVTTISVKEVVKFYTDYFTPLGFTVTTNLTTSDSAIVQYVGPGERVVDMVISQEDGTTGVVITYKGSFDVASGDVNVNTGTGSAPSAATQYVPVSIPLNIELVFDASGSMADPFGATTRILAARQAVKYIAQTLPDDSNVRVGMRVFGQAGDNTNTGRATSCASTELLVPLKNNAGTELLTAAAAYQPTGWTPIALALNQAAMDFKPTPDIATRNVVILISDGEETCGGDPTAVANILYGSNAKITTHVVAIASTKEIAPMISAISVKGGGVFLNTTKSVELASSLLALIANEVSNAGGTMVVPSEVVSELSADNTKVTFTNGQIDIAGLVQESAEIGKVSIEGSMARLNVTVGGTSIDLDGINNAITIQTGDGGSVTIDGGSGSINIEGDDGSISIGPGGINIDSNQTDDEDDN